ncbi:hypothetical protein ACLHK8_01290 [Pediococcus sp. M21F004]|uniref:hypothetical protein n=1 Tax=Pediococcus sp. M21F004 TaxID=3390033 RepID=UPI003DA6FE47
MNNIIYIVPGFISYILLRPFGLFNFYNETDRQLTLIILSVINSALSTVISKFLFKGNSIWILLLTSLVITIFYFGIFTLYNKFSQAIANKLNMSLYDNQGTMEHILSENFKDGKELFLISFDFEGNFISSGYVKNIDDKGNHQVALNGQDETIYSVDEARDLYKENDLNSIIVDYKDRVKSYVIIS